MPQGSWCPSQVCPPTWYETTWHQRKSPLALRLAPPGIVARRTTRVDNKWPAMVLVTSVTSQALWECFLNRTALINLQFSGTNKLVFVGPCDSRSLKCPNRFWVVAVKPSVKPLSPYGSEPPCKAQELDSEHDDQPIRIRHKWITRLRHVSDYLNISKPQVWLQKNGVFVVPQENPPTSRSCWNLPRRCVVLPPCFALSQRSPSAAQRPSFLLASCQVWIVKPLGKMRKMMKNGNMINHQTVCLIFEKCHNLVLCDVLSSFSWIFFATDLNHFEPNKQGNFCHDSGSHSLNRSVSPRVSATRPIPRVFAMALPSPQIPEEIAPRVWNGG